MPVPLLPGGVLPLRRAHQIGTEVRHAIKNGCPVPAHLLASGEGPVRVRGLVAAIVRVKAGYVSETETTNDNNNSRLTVLFGRT
jgi:hypothetical protein